MCVEDGREAERAKLVTASAWAWRRLPVDAIDFA
jgi:hypothetical protein